MMDDDVVENNLANDDRDAGTGTYDELEVDNDTEVTDESNDTPDTEDEEDDVTGPDSQPLPLDDGESNVADNNP